MGLVRFVVIGLIFWVIAVILVLMLDITLTSFGLPLNAFTEIPLQLLILYYGVSKFGIKKRSRNIMILIYLIRNLLLYERVRFFNREERFFTNRCRID